MRKYGISISGCDDATRFNMELTDDEWTAILKVSAESEKCSTYQCQPVIGVLGPFTDEDDES